jgi:hypothetical protein
MLPFYSWNFVLLVAFAIFYHRAAEFEDASSILWTGLSVVISTVIWQGLHWGLLAMILGQVLLFIGIAVFRAMRDE